MCNKVGDSYLLPLKFISEWSLTSKMIQKIDKAAYFNDYIVFGDMDSDILRFYRA